jgi:hypothetical protein
MTTRHGVNTARWLTAGVLWLAIGATAALGGDRGAGTHCPAPKRHPATQNRFVHVPPGHERLQAQAVPAYPWLVQGQKTPTYNWGYFGGRYRPRVVEQHAYSDDYSQWSFRPGW